MLASDATPPPTTTSAATILKPQFRRILVGLITSPTMNYLAMPTVHASRALVNAFVADRMLAIKACSAGELGGFRGSSSSSANGTGGVDAQQEALLRKQPPLSLQDIESFHPSTAWFIE